MEILFARCSHSECFKYPELIGILNGAIKFACEIHGELIEPLENTDIARAIEQEEKDKFVKNSLKLSSNLRLLKCKIIDSAQELTEVILKESQKQLKSIDTLISQISTNINFAIINSKIFDRIEENLSQNLKKTIQASSLNNKPIKELISSYFSRNFFEQYQELSENRESREYHELIDKRLLSKKTTLEKKLQLLNRTLAFSKNPLQTVPKMHLNLLITQKDKTILEGPTNIIISLEKNLIITLKDEKKIQFWKLGKQIRKTFECSNDNKKVNEILLLKDSNFLLVRFDTGFAKLDINRQEFLSFQNRQVGTVILTKLFLNDNFLATGTFDGTVIIWSVENLIEERSYRMHSSYYNGSISCFDINSTATWIVSGGVNGELCLRKISIYDDSGAEYRVGGHSGGVTAVSFSPTSSYIISGGEDRCIKIWDPLDFTSRIYEKKVSDMRIRDISFSLDSSLVLTGSNKKVILWKINTEEKTFENIKIDKKSILSKIGDYFNDALCFSKYYKVVN